MSIVTESKQQEKSNSQKCTCPSCIVHPQWVKGCKCKSCLFETIYQFCHSKGLYNRDEKVKVTCIMCKQQVDRSEAYLLTTDMEKWKEETFVADYHCLKCWQNRPEYDNKIY